MVEVFLRARVFSVRLEPQARVALGQTRTGTTLDHVRKLRN